MRYLLDVNALLAWEHSNSPHHDGFHAWAKQAGPANCWTCAHTELGFLRVSMQIFDYSLGQASEALAALKAHAGGLIDLAPSPRLATWAEAAAKTSDAYLVQMAQANAMQLATFDAGIKGPAVVHIPG
jgi:predicted nucleic acid-binding protein